MFGNIEGVLTPINDLKLVPKWIPNELVTGTCKSLSCSKARRIHFVVVLPLSTVSENLFLTSLAIICLIAFLMALIFTLGSGNYWVEVFNSYVGSVPLLIIALFEIIGVIYVRGMKT